MKLVAIRKKILLLSFSLLLPVGADADNIELGLNQAASGNYYLSALLGSNVETRMLLDTGSGYVSLSRNTFERISADAVTEPVRHITGRMADGRNLSVPIYRIARLRLADTCVLTDIEVAVFPHADRDILGLNALRRLQPFTIHLDTPRLSATCARG